MNSLNKNIESARQILTQAIEISTNSIIDVFVEYSSHTKGLNIRIMLDGWSEHAQTDLNKTIYIDWKDSEKKLQGVLDYLLNLKEENK